ncbi:MAG: C40 family peptidase [Lachnospiraceae bacterium]|nr:C40 family peptidase [Lachnospiraceae bacterium]
MDEMDLEISQDAGEELTEAEYNEILGLEDTEGAGDSEQAEDDNEADGIDDGSEDIGDDDGDEKKKLKKKRKKAEEDVSEEDILEEFGLAEWQLKAFLRPEGMKAISGEYHTGQDDGVGESQNENTDFTRTAIKEIDGNVDLNLGDNLGRENIATANGSGEGIQHSASEAIVDIPRYVQNDNAGVTRDDNVEVVRKERVENTPKENIQNSDGDVLRDGIEERKPNASRNEGKHSLVGESGEYITHKASEAIAKIPCDARNDKVDAARDGSIDEVPNSNEKNGQNDKIEDGRTAKMGVSRNDGVDIARGENKIAQTDEAVNAGEVAAYEPEGKHSFSQGIDARTYAVYAGQMVGEMSKDSIRQSDENFYAGQKQIRHFSVPMMETISVMGAVSTASAIRDDLEDCALGAVKALKLIESGHIVTEELSLPREDLREALRSLLRRDANLIIKNAGVISDLISVRSKLIGEGDDIKRLPEEIQKHVKSKAYFDLREQKTADVLKAYCKRSKSDIIRNVKPGSMNSRGLKKLLKEADEKGFSSTDKAVLRLFLKQRKMREARQKVNILRTIKRYAYLASRKLTEADGNIVAGVTAYQRVAITAAGIANTARFAVRTAGFTHRVWTKYGLVGRYVGAGERLVIRKAADGTTYVLKKTASGIKAAKASVKRTISHTKPVRTVKAAKETIAHTETVKRFKEAGEAARRAQTAISMKTARVAHTASKVRDGARVVFMPFRKIKKAIGKVFSFFSGLRAVIAGAFFGIIILYVVVVILLTGILSIFTIEGEAVMNIILCNDESYVPDTVSMLDGLFSDEKDEAMAIATGPPQDPNVFYGHIISRYGAPLSDGSWTDGYKIYYRDMDGNIIENGVNNIKDVIVLAYVLMDGDFDNDPAARDALITDIWKQLNPGVTWEETSIYTAEIGDDTYRYHCDSEADYDEMDDMRDAGVKFYGSVHSYTGDGCRGDEDDRYCDGHSVKVCYGHKDIKVYITVGFMEDVFAGEAAGDGSGSLGYPDGEIYQKYLSAFKERGGWNDDAIEWANALYAAEWFDLYGSDPAGGSGFSVADTLSPEEIEKLTEQYGSIEGTRSAVSEFALDMVGKIPYYWGGKPVSGDFDGNHFYSDVKPDGSQYHRTKRGLDCSGFVAFVYWHVLGHPLGASSTGDFTNGRYKKISASELKPGDVGLLRTGYSNGNSVNHIGIFVGRDAFGGAVWVHCTGGSTGKTVCGNYNFSVYYSILG